MRAFQSLSVLWLVGLTACLDAPQVECGDNVCPAGLECAAGGCVNPMTGAICGDGAVTGTEACDDGNLESGDGCAANCGSDESCGNLVTDFAAGESCDDGNLDDGDGCHQDCQLSRCGDGVVDPGEGCDAGAANSDAPDAPCRPSCLSARCGDGVLDSAEVCDDGNVQFDDGCAGDCASTEVCGNQVADFAVGEQCDAGSPGQSGDGCTSNCLLEVATWIARAPRSPSAAVGARIAFDRHRGQAVLFGGEGRPETWESNGRSWQVIATAANPSPRDDAAMVYDPVRRVVVLFGGWRAGRLDDTWEYDGVTWTEIVTANAPSARMNARMVFVDSLGKVVLFGGDQLGPTNDLWTFDGADWQAVTTNTPPPARREHGMAYDSVRDRIVVFGGEGVGTALHSDTWEYAPTTQTWTPIVVTGPSARRNITMDFDTEVNKVIMYGGTTSTGDAKQTWIYDGAWTQPGANPTVLNMYDPTMVYDPVRKRSWMVIDGTSYLYNAANNTWATSTLPSKPGTGQTAGVAYDAARGRTVVLHYAGNTEAQTWELAEAGWVFKGATPAQRSFALGYDPLRRQVVMFGGDRGSTRINETVVFDGSSWQALAVTGPSPRAGAQMAFDPARAGLVMTGGRDPAFNVLRDSWLWNGSVWTLLPVDSLPVDLSPVQLIFDEQRDQLVLLAARGLAYEVWALEGTAWTLVPTSGFPTGVDGVTAVFHPLRRRMIGILRRGAEAQAWELEGSVWRQLATATVPGADIYPQFSAFDLARGRLRFLDNFFTEPQWFDLAFTTAADPREACVEALADTDGDGFAGCSDPDCLGRCAPTCVSGEPCALASPRCGDGSCDPVEDHRICPADCSL